ncbi:uncharacterized [Tachysurus ichikawai]
MEVPYFIKSRDRTDEFLMPEVTVLCASLLFPRSVLCVGECRGRTGGLATPPGREAKETERAVPFYEILIALAPRHSFLLYNQWQSEESLERAALSGLHHYCLSCKVLHSHDRLDFRSFGF